MEKSRHACVLYKAKAGRGGLVNPEMERSLTPSTHTVRQMLHLEKYNTGILQTKRPTFMLRDNTLLPALP